MILSLSLPDLPAGATQVLVESWLAAPGDRVAFGETLAEVAVRQRDRVIRPNRARDIVRRIGREGTERRGGRPGADIEAKVVYNRFEVIASDDGYLRIQLAAAGDTVDAGAALALLTSDPAEEVDEAMLGSALAFRAIAQAIPTASIDLDELIEEVLQWQ